MIYLASTNPFQRFFILVYFVFLSHGLVFFIFNYYVCSVRIIKLVLSDIHNLKLPFKQNVITRHFCFVITFYHIVSLNRSLDGGLLTILHICKQIVNFSKNIAFFAKNSHIYTNAQERRAKMTHNHKRTEDKCKQFVNFSENVSFLANYCAIYMNPQNKKTKEMAKWEWQNTMKMT